jgi:hypothetical protein
MAPRLQLLADMVRPLFAATLLFASQARAYEFKRDSSGERIKWNAPSMFYADAKLEQALDAPGARAALAEAMKRLAQAAPGLSLSLTEGEGGKVGYDFSSTQNRSDVIALDEWSYDSDAVAITVVTVDARTHAIVDADIAFNLHGRRWSVMGEKPELARYDVQNTFTHELGHAVGLAHSQAAEAVMYGKTHPGEMNKRRFETDDTEALSQLYPTVSALPEEETEPAQGCSTTATAPAGLGLLGLFALARRHALKAATIALAVALPLNAQASDSMARADKAVKVAMVGTVTRATTLPPQEGVTVLRTELEVQVKECLATPCPAKVKLYVPGGRWGNYEQRVGGMDTPKEGTTVGLSRDVGSDSYVRLETLKNEGERDAFLRAHVGRAVTAAK